MNEYTRKIVLVVVLVVIGGALYYWSDNTTGLGKAAQINSVSVAEKEGKYPKAREITQPSGFINSPSKEGKDKPFTLEEYIGKKVILVDFWTYSCINCVRTQPYLNAWQEKYKDKGLLIVGVHTPEFEFEKIYENVKQASDEASITYPVVMDNDYGTWRAYQNSYWPRKYLIDIDGYIVYDHIGEGGYEETEQRIQEALKERAQKLGEDIGGFSGLTKEAESSDGKPRTPEIYFGASRNEEHLANGNSGTLGMQTFALPNSLTQDKLYLSGVWNIEGEYAKGTKGASFKLKYRAKDVYMVLSGGQGATVKVFVDGAPVSEELRGSDLNALRSDLSVKEERMYKVIESDEWAEHEIELRVENGSLEAFTFTFG